MATLQWTVGVDNLSGVPLIVFAAAGALAAIGLWMIKLFMIIPPERE